MGPFESTTDCPIPDFQRFTVTRLLDDCELLPPPDPLYESDLFNFPLAMLPLEGFGCNCPTVTGSVHTYEVYASSSSSANIEAYEEFIADKYFQTGYGDADLDDSSILAGDWDDWAQGCVKCCNFYCNWVCAVVRAFKSVRGIFGASDEQWNGDPPSGDGGWGLSFDGYNAYGSQYTHSGSWVIRPYGSEGPKWGIWKTRTGGRLKCGLTSFTKWIRLDDDASHWDVKADCDPNDPCNVTYLFNLTLRLPQGPPGEGCYDEPSSSSSSALPSSSSSSSSSSSANPASCNAGCELCHTCDFESCGACHNETPSCTICDTCDPESPCCWCNTCDLEGCETCDTCDGCDAEQCGPTSDMECQSDSEICPCDVEICSCDIDCDCVPGCDNCDYEGCGYCNTCENEGCGSCDSCNVEGTCRTCDSCNVDPAGCDSCNTCNVEGCSGNDDPSCCDAGCNSCDFESCGFCDTCNVEGCAECDTCDLEGCNACDTCNCCNTCHACHACNVECSTQDTSGCTICLVCNLECSTCDGETGCMEGCDVCEAEACGWCNTCDPEGCGWCNICISEEPPSSSSSSAGCPSDCPSDCPADGTKTAIADSAEGPVGLFCTESPEVWFEDRVEFKLDGSIVTVKLDEMFIKVCKPGSIRPVRVSTTVPTPLGIFVRGNTLVVKSRRPAKLSGAVTLVGERKDCTVERFKRYTEDEYRSNQRFWRRAYE